MRKEIGILLAWVVFLSGCVGKPMEKQNEQTKKEDAVLRLYTLTRINRKSYFYFLPLVLF